MRSPQILWSQGKGYWLSVGLGWGDWVINEFRLWLCHYDLWP